MAESTKNEATRSCCSVDFFKYNVAMAVRDALLLGKLCVCGITIYVCMSVLLQHRIETEVVKKTYKIPIRHNAEKPATKFPEVLRQLKNDANLAKSGEVLDEVSVEKDFQREWKVGVVNMRRFDNVLVHLDHDSSTGADIEAADPYEHDPDIDQNGDESTDDQAIQIKLDKLVQQGIDVDYAREILNQQSLHHNNPELQDAMKDGFLDDAHPQINDMGALSNGDTDKGIRLDEEEDTPPGLLERTQSLNETNNGSEILNVLENLNKSDNFGQEDRNSTGYNILQVYGVPNYGSNNTSHTGTFLPRAEKRKTEVTDGTGIARFQNEAIRRDLSRAESQLASVVHLEHDTRPEAVDTNKWTDNTFKAVGVGDNEHKLDNQEHLSQNQHLETGFQRQEPNDKSYLPKPLDNEQNERNLKSGHSLNIISYTNVRNNSKSHIAEATKNISDPYNYKLNNSETVPADNDAIGRRGIPQDAEPRPRYKSPVDAAAPHDTNPEVMNGPKRTLPASNRRQGGYGHSGYSNTSSFTDESLRDTPLNITTARHGKSPNIRKPIAINSFQGSVYEDNLPRPQNKTPAAYHTNKTHIPRDGLSGNVVQNIGNAVPAQQRGLYRSNNNIRQSQITNQKQHHSITNQLANRHKDAYLVQPNTNQSADSLHNRQVIGRPHAGAGNSTRRTWANSTLEQPANAGHQLYVVNKKSLEVGQERIHGHDDQYKSSLLTTLKSQQPSKSYKQNLISEGISSNNMTETIREAYPQGAPDVSGTRQANISGILQSNETGRQLVKKSRLPSQGVQDHVNVSSIPRRNNIQYGYMDTNLQLHINGTSFRRTSRKRPKIADRINSTFSRPSHNVTYQMKLGDTCSFPEISVDPMLDDMIDNRHKIDLPVLSNYRNPCWYERLPPDFYMEYRTSVHMFPDQALKSFRKIIPVYNLRRQQRCAWRLRCLPLVYIIGVAKSGTSDLHNTLMSHPHLQKGATKEPFFWDNTRWRRDATINDFLNLYDEVAEKIRKTYQTRVRSAGVYPYHPVVTIDSSVNALFNFDGSDRVLGNKRKREPAYVAAHLIKNITPNAKVVLIIRNPTERLYSSYVFYNTVTRPSEISAKEFHLIVVEHVQRLTSCFERRPLGDCLYDPQATKVNKTVTVHAGIYYGYIRKWIEVFPDMQIIRTEDYKVNRTGIYNSLVNYIGLDPDKSTVAASDAIVGEGPKRRFQMWPKTRRILDDFYRPFNELLAKLLHDERFLFRS